MAGRIFRSISTFFLDVRLGFRCLLSPDCSSVMFARSVHDAGWAKIPVRVACLVNIDCLYFRSFTGGRFPLRESPHYEFVRERLEGSGTGRSWLEYKAKQHGTELGDMARFAAIFDSSTRGLASNVDSLTPILLEFCEEGITIVDGAHRAAGWAFLYPDRGIPARFVSQ